MINIYPGVMSYNPATQAMEPVHSLKNALNVHDADVHNSIVNKHVHQHTATATTLASGSAIDAYQIELTSVVGFVVGDYVHIDTTTVETTHPQIRSIVGTTVTLDRRLDRAHFAGDAVIKVIINMALQNGSMAAPQEYWMGPEAGEVFHVTRLLFAASHDAVSDLSTFLGIPALANGLLLRVKVGGVYDTLANWKTNADIKADLYDLEFDVRKDKYGTSGRGNFKDAGSVIRLDGALGDRVEIYIQDTMTGLGLNVFTMKMQGHIEGL